MTANELPRASRDLLLGWLLLLIDRGVSHGYDLSRALAEEGIGVDTAALYRTLRQLEADKLLRSRWQAPTMGPRRRAYVLTVKGRRRLNALALSIANARDAHEAFLRRARPVAHREAA